MRDMHDGLGSALTSSLAVAEQGEVQPAALVGLLRECVDDLRAVIDSLEPVDNDLAALLATLRFRLGQRLDAAGIQLDWRVQDLPPLAWLGPSEALQVMRIVQEALANVVKHARARRVQLTAARVGEQVELCIRDDGEGFDTSALRLRLDLARRAPQRTEDRHSAVGAAQRVTL
jgi:signal transduction histidine kinase